MLLVGIGASASVAGFSSARSARSETHSTTESSRTESNSARQTANQNRSRVRIIHLSPDAPSVDVYVDDELLYENVTPFNTGSGYTKLETGTHTVTFVPAGRSLDEAVLDRRVDLQAKEYTLAAIGEVASSTDTPLQIVQFTDDNSALEPDVARLRLVHASPDAQTVSVTTADEGRTLFENIGFGESEFTELSAGDYSVSVRTTTDCGETTARFPLSLRGGRVYTGFLEGYLTPENEPADKPLVLALTPSITP